MFMFQTRVRQDFMMSYIVLNICLHHDVIIRENSKTWPCLDPFLPNLIRWIQLCDKKKRILHSLTVDEILTRLIPFFRTRLINREYVHSVAVYQKYLTRLGELIIFEPWRKNYHFSQPS